MTALEQWQQQVKACRQARNEPDPQIWQRTAGWYDAWVRHNSYITIVLSRLWPLVNSHWRILEIGPGSGGFTIPLADVAQEIVAVEPSAGMRAVLARNLAAASKNNVHVIPKHIEEGLEDIQGAFDLALASYSLYNVESIDTVVQGLMRLSRHVIALMGTGEQQRWYRDLYHRFRGREPVPPPQMQYFYPVLLEIGIHADVQVFWTSCNYVFDSEEALLDWWMHHFHLPEADRAALWEALLPLTERRDGQIGIYRRSRAALVWIERGRNVRAESGKTGMNLNIERSSRRFVDGRQTGYT